MVLLLPDVCGCDADGCVLTLSAVFEIATKCISRRSETVLSCTLRLWVNNQLIALVNKSALCTGWSRKRDQCISCPCLLYAWNKSNNVGTVEQQLMSNAVPYDIYSYSLEDTTEIKQLALVSLQVHLSNHFDSLTWFLLNYAGSKWVVWFLFIRKQNCKLMLLKYGL